jgi:hypothetical protein
MGAKTVVSEGQEPEALFSYSEAVPPGPDQPGESGGRQRGEAESDQPWQGMSWSWEMDFDAFLAALAEPAPWYRPVPPQQPAATSQAEIDPVEAEFAEYREARDDGRVGSMPLSEVAGLVAESLRTGPDLAGWLGTTSAESLQDGALAGIASSYRRLASWAQAGELAVVAELASRSAAADKRIGVDEKGRPARMPDEACAQVSLALTMSHAAASWWSELGVTLRWRLAATGAALRDGEIDLSRARLIAEATALLDDETAKAVEAKVLPRAGKQTTGQLRAALRRAVISADPDGAERRREEAERRAKVVLYPDAEGTASLAGSNLPGIRAAAAMARITALAKAMKASGFGGGIDLLRSQVFLGLLLGTLPYIPPAPDGPPDDPPPDDPPTDDSPTGGPGEEPPSTEPPGDGGHRHSSGRGGDPADGPRRRPASPDAPGPDAPGSAANRQEPRTEEGSEPEAGSDPDAASVLDPAELDEAEPEFDESSPLAADMPRATCRPPPDEDDDPAAASRPPPTWPEVLAFLPAAPATMGKLRPAGGGLLDLRVPWSTLGGESGEPGHLSRLGPVTPAQARHLADLASRDPEVKWRVIVTRPDGRALAVTHVSRTRAGSRRSDPDAGTGPSAGDSSLVGRVTVTISQNTLEDQAGDLPEPLARMFRAAERAAERAERKAAADAAVADGCAHNEASLAYRPPPRLWEFVTARDLTCRFPTCRQPAWRCDLDHTTPYDQGGRTCPCNLGGLCRFHHQLKQHRLWRLTQPVPGAFTWITPAGRAYAIEPDMHPV